MAFGMEDVHVKIETEIKEQAERILDSLSISASNAITMFYKQIILHRGIPFEVRFPVSQPLDISLLGENQINEELEKGYADMVEGRTKPAGKVFYDIRRDYGL
ncbi:MAG: type II toxin-antitoxin system RelB/DinJ family antitoxin [Lachnospiraceae bacterium]|nr:type II toxin-antitoxin system RelB/DinJ family antitoxin [Lachnospiraceae bacterium]